MKSISVFRKVAMSIVISLLFLMCVETILTALNYPDVGIYRGDPNYVWWLRKNLDRQVLHVEEEKHFTVITDDKGFRIAEQNIKDDHITKTEDYILALGCSTTFGWGVAGEQTWTHLLSQNVKTPVVNAGVPGWSTFQAKHGLHAMEIPMPKIVLMSYGVRDQQLSYGSDKEIKPTPIMFQLQIARLIRKGRGISRGQHRTSGVVSRVSVGDYGRNIDEISAIWSNVPILYFVFPNLRTGVSGHDQILLEKGGIVFGQEFKESDFFIKDTLHLNRKGNQHLSKMLTPYVTKLLGETNHIE